MLPLIDIKNEDTEIEEQEPPIGDDGDPQETTVKTIIFNGRNFVKCNNIGEKLKIEEDEFKIEMVESNNEDKESVDLVNICTRNSFVKCNIGVSEIQIDEEEFKNKIIGLPEDHSGLPEAFGDIISSDIMKAVRPSNVFSGIRETPQKTRRNSKRERTNKRMFSCYVSLKKLASYPRTPTEWKKNVATKSDLKAQQRKLFPCDECGKKFTREDLVKRHQSVHNKAFSCSLCTKSFASKLYLDTHNLRHHTAIQKSFKCNQCPAMFIVKHYLNKHIGRVHRKPFACDECPKRFLYELNLNNHKNTHSVFFVKKSYECYICGSSKKFRQSSALIDHMRSHTGDKPFACDKCDRRYRIFESLRHHLLTHGEKRFPCDECHRKFFSLYRLNQHKRQHAIDRPLKCDGCPRSFLVQRYLDNHKLTQCGKKDFIPRGAKFSCHICSYAPRYFSMLRAHMAIHTGQSRKRYVCSLCSKTFTCKYYLKKHCQLHSGEKPFSCDQCNKSYVLKSNLEKHKRIHDVGKRFSCKECSAAFTHQVSLKVHMRKHTGNEFSCNVCSKKFISNYLLRIHQRKHTGERQFSCDLCRKSFAEKRKLFQHQSVHTDERPFACVKCNQKYKSKYKCIAHESQCDGLNHSKKNKTK